MTVVIRDGLLHDPSSGRIPSKEVPNDRDDDLSTDGGDETPKVQVSSVLTHVAAPEVVRSISLMTLMMYACACLGRKNDGAHQIQWYSYSKPVVTFDYFLSHSWRDGRFSKALGLTLHISCWSAIGVTCLIVFVIAFLQFFEVVPLPSYTCKLMDDRLSTHGVSCLILACMGWTVYLILAPFLRPSEMWFLDKACICQTDPDLKKKGIRALREFLERSNTMVILLTPNYFTRGWCTFEVATFIASRGIDAVQIVPLSRSALVMCAKGISWFAALVYHASIIFGLDDAVATIPGQPKIFGVKAGELLVFCAPPGLVFGIAYVIIEYYVAQKQVIVEQVKNFSMEKAEFFEDSDRAFVINAIRTLFGTVSKFEKEVHTAVYRKIEMKLGSDRWQCIPYDAVVLGALPCFQWCVDMFCTDPGGIKLTDFFMGTTLTFMFLPLFFAMLGVWAKVKLRLTGGRPAYARHLASAVASLFACIMGVAGMTLTLGVYIYEPQHLALILWLAYIAATVATFAEWPEMRRAPSQEDGNSGRCDEDAGAPMLPQP